MAVLETFTDRVVEHPGRYTLTDTGGAELGTYDLSRDEGTVTEAGTPLNAAHLNPVVNEINDINDRLDGLLLVEQYNQVSGTLTPITPGDNTFYINFDAVPRGYTAAGVVGVNTSGTGSSNIRLRGFFLSSGRVGIKMRNEGPADLTAVTVTAYVLFAREGVI